MRLLLSIGACLFGGCTFVYDSQYDDRATELEAFRSEIFSADAGVKVLATGGDRLFWVDVLRPNDQNVLHSIAPPNFTATDYTWSIDNSESTILGYQFSSKLIATCQFGTVHGFSATAANTELGTTGNGQSKCAVDGTTVYFLVGGRLDRWTPAGLAPNPEPDLPVAIDFALTDIAGSVDAFGVSGNLAVVTESGGDIYTVDLVNKTTTWLENDEPAGGSVFFDDKGVLFDTNGNGLRYIEFAGKVETAFTDLVADGGYHLNFKHDDAQEPTNEFVIHGRHVIYRSLHGIFAYGLDTRNVTDLLLNRGEGFDAEIEYQRPVVTSGGFLYVQSKVGFEAGPVYQVDLDGRLK